MYRFSVGYKVAKGIQNKVYYKEQKRIQEQQGRRVWKEISVAKDWGGERVEPNRYRLSGGKVN